ncbi:hypothetical protein MB84_28205 (plasmid) [Pandoraea oxalativorans]|uniref:Uncharacterized protein n=1 Tax=Pandoraea oxalativorans TaxID=573737 RepID=A0A0G3IHP3_9BURK|nr:hypothetical protein MB84_28205 [Pandoraea oxalativorans]
MTMSLGRRANEQGPRFTRRFRRLADLHEQLGEVIFQRSAVRYPHFRVDRYRKISVLELEGGGKGSQRPQRLVRFRLPVGDDRQLAQYLMHAGSQLFTQRFILRCLNHRSDMTPVCHKFLDRIEPHGFATPRKLKNICERPGLPSSTRSMAMRASSMMVVRPASSGADCRPPVRKGSEQDP